MLRLTEIKLPLQKYTDDDLRQAIVERLSIAPDELLGFTVFRRGHDARKKSAIIFVFTLDVELKDEAAVLKRLKAANNDAHIGPTPDTHYKFVAQAPAGLKSRPIVIGTGPCGLLAGLVQVANGAQCGAVAQSGRFAKRLQGFVKQAAHQGDLPLFKPLGCGGGRRFRRLRLVLAGMCGKRGQGKEQCGT